MKQFPAVLVTGARQTGKTSLVRHLFPDASYLTLDYPANALAAKTAPEDLLNKYPEPVIIDEIQYAPELMRYIKVRIDNNRTSEKKRKNKLNGRYILTGSQIFPLMEGVSESLAGRCGILNLDTLSYSEIIESNRSLKETDFIFLGGYPEIHTGAEPELWFSSYVATYLERDVRNVLRVVDLQEFGKFLKICALRTGQVVNYTDIARDCGVSPNTARKWLGLLVTSGIVHLLEPYFGNRAKRVIKSPKLMFLDTGLASFLAGFISANELFDSPYAGAFFETFIFSEILKHFHAQGKRAPVFYWRTVSGHEVDILIEKSPDYIIAVETKWKENPDSKDAAGLKTIASVEKKKIKEKIIVAKTDVTYKLADEIWVMNASEFLRRKVSDSGLERTRSG